MKKFLVISISCLSLIVFMGSMLAGSISAASANELAITAPNYDYDMKGVTDWGNYKGIDVACNNDLTAEAYGTNMDDILGPYITINGVPLMDRINQDPALNIGDTSLMYGNAAALNVLNTKSFRIFYCGGGTGDLDPDGVNTIVFDKDMPVGGSTLGRTITMIMDPAAGIWTDSTQITSAASSAASSSAASSKASSAASSSKASSASSTASSASQISESAASSSEESIASGSSEEAASSLEVSEASESTASESEVLSEGSGEPGANTTVIIVIVVAAVVILGGGAALYFIRKKK